MSTNKDTNLDKNKDKDGTNDIDIDIDKTLKYEKKKLEQHAHMNKLFQQRKSTNISSSSGCSSCNRR